MQISFIAAALLILASTGSAAPTNKFMGWYRPVASELAGWNNAYLSAYPATLVYTKAQYGYSQQLLVITNVFITAERRLLPNWQGTLRDKALLYHELLNNGTIVGFFIGDELMWTGFPYAQLLELTDALRAEFPSCFMWENEASTVYSCDPWGTDPEKCHDFNHRPINITNGVPPALNVTSIDTYNVNPNTSHVLKVKAFYAAQLVPRLHPGQRLFVIPGADGSACNPLCDLQCSDRLVARRAAEFLEWVETDAMIAGAMAWEWKSTGPSCHSKLYNGIGCRDLPLGREEWEKVGKKIAAMPLA